MHFRTRQGVSSVRVSRKTVLSLAIVSAGIGPPALRNTSEQGPAAVHNGKFRDLSGKEHRLFEPKRSASVYFFIAHDCPVANSYVPEMNRIAAKYGRNGMGMFAVYTEKDFGPSAAMKHHKEYGFQFPGIVDADRKLTKELGASVTPEAVVLDSKGITKYRGRVDDLYAAFGQRRSAPSHRDLRQVLDSIVAGKAVKYKTTKAVGCFIPLN